MTEWNLSQEHKVIEQIQPPVRSVQPAAGEHTSSWLFSISPSLSFFGCILQLVGS